MIHPSAFQLHTSMRAGVDMQNITVKNDEVFIGKRFSVTFQRTLRIPDDGGTYPLPPGLGRIPVSRVEDFAGRVPGAWLERGGILIPMYQREALWLGFDGASWKPNAVQIGIGEVNAVSGSAWKQGLKASPQNYIVCPDQPWLDGINAGDGFIRQFVAMPLGSGHTVEAQLTGREDVGGIQLRVYEPKPGRFPDRPPRRSPDMMMRGRAAAMASPVGGMGIGAGGRMKQKIYPDKHSLDTWETKTPTPLFVHIVNSEQYRELTGHHPPPSPISAETYTKHGYPWFDLYDETEGDIAASERLSGVKSIREKEAEKKPSGRATTIERSVKVDPSQVRKITRRKS